MWSAALPLSGLYNFASLFLGSNHKATFCNTICNRFLYINMFSSFYCVDHYLTMPMVRRSNNDGINLLVIQQFPIVRVSLWRVFPKRRIVRHPFFNDVGVDVTNANKVNIIHLEK